MNGLTGPLLEITRHLDSAGIPYMVIGGFANLQWGRPRITEDLDITVSVPEREWDDFIRAVATRFDLLPADPASFARETRVLPVRAGSVRIDLIFAGMLYEEEAIRRSVPVTVEGESVHICTAEDLILHKLVSERPRDLEDVEGVIIRQAGNLDRGYLDPKIRELAAGMERPAIESFYRECLRKAGL